MKSSIDITLKSFGAHSRSQVSLTGNPTSRHINYLDLINQPNEEVTPSVVVEFQRKPILYVVEARRLSEDPKIREEKLLELRRNLACRGDAQYMAILNLGQIEVYSIGLEKKLPEIIKKKISDADASSVIPSIALGKLYPKIDVKEEKIHDLLFRLMNQTTGDLIRKGLKPDDALSLTGRAVFLRLLMDRKVITKDKLSGVCPGANALEDCLSDSEKADFSNTWLDTIFNGDLLPFSKENISQILENVDENKRSGVFTTLTLILKKAEPSGAGWYQTRLNWETIDFAHVPVGLLSQVYERHCHTYDPTHAKETSIHYTPRNIAEYMVEEVFSGLKNNHKAKILDPAAGAGVFLVICFRKLVENWWGETGERPDRERIREILYNQIKGFEINIPALNLAAFSLYLTAIELDPDPCNLEKIKFEKIIGKVLFDVRSPEEKEGCPVLGSLNRQNNQEHGGIYDIVIGNPPWKPFTKKELRNQLQEIIREIADDRGLKDIAKGYRNPGGVPDLPFVWRAMEWCKEGGRIAYALHSRVLFGDSNLSVEARNALFSAVKVTGILNGAYLRGTDVWPLVKAPFCLLFAKNAVPDLESLFTYISPDLENEINDKGYFRIDYKSSQPIQISYSIDNPSLLKTLFRGTALDVEIIKKLQNNTLMSVSEYWQNCGFLFSWEDIPGNDSERIINYLVDDLKIDWARNAEIKKNDNDKIITVTNGENSLRLKLKEREDKVILEIGGGKTYEYILKKERGGKRNIYNLADGNGYRLGKKDKSGEPLKKYRNLTPKILERYLMAEYSTPFFIDPDKLPMFNLDNDKVESTRNLGIYQGPMVIVKKFPSADRDKSRAMLCLKNLAFNESFYSYCGNGHPKGEELVKYLFLLFNSDLFLYYALMTSGSFGVGLEQIFKEVFDDFPIIPIENLSKEDLQTIDSLAYKLIKEKQKSWSELDHFVYKIYNIDRFDQEVIRDSLDVSLPFTESKKRAQEPPEPEEIKRFAERLEHALNPFYEIVGKQISIKIMILENYPWAFLELNDDKTENDTNGISEKIILKVMEMANKTGASRIIIRSDKKPLLIGILKQYRYWTPTRARLTAIHLLRNKDISHH